MQEEGRLWLKYLSQGKKYNLPNGRFFCGEIMEREPYIFNRTIPDGPIGRTISPLEDMEDPKSIAGDDELTKEVRKIVEKQIIRNALGMI